MRGFVVALGLRGVLRGLCLDKLAFGYVPAGQGRGFGVDIGTADRAWLSFHKAFGKDSGLSAEKGILQLPVLFVYGGRSPDDGSFEKSLEFGRSLKSFSSENMTGEKEAGDE